MGSHSSKFKKYVQHGDEFAAMQIYQTCADVRKNIDPNLSYGEKENHNTALHYAAKHGMKHLLRTFLNDLGGNPNKKNALNETVLHVACQLNQTKSFSIQERRAACVHLLLIWKGVPLNNEGERERVDLNAQDKEGNTALHWAASTGLKRCVELLITHGAPLFVENNDKLTPCDMAMRGSHHDIARLLETRMVFSDNADLVNEDEIINEQEEVYSGLRSQDLQEAKDELLVDTSDMLKIPLFTAEALLRDNEWSRELLLEKWMKDPIDCCKTAGVQAPSSLLHHASSTESSIFTADGSDDINEITCAICTYTFTNCEQPVKMSCRHSFCKTCWQSYLTTKIQDGDAHHILCPAFGCQILVPVEFIEKIVSPDMARRYLQFDIKAFVETNKSIKWCPIPGCGRAVYLPEAQQTDTRSINKLVPITSHAVDCGKAHFFCWECLGEAHAPCGCQQWQEWHMKIKEIKPEELKASCSGSEDAANCLWLVTNSKPCPNCKSPIQKNEGCNHMKCCKCKFDFCWVCQESWKRHSSATGGYFRCNRFEAVHKADEKQGSLITEALDRNNQLQETSRFLHFYTRFRNHENSQKLEEPLLTSVRQKMEILASNLGIRNDEDAGEKGTKFIEDGVRELLKARRVLCGSYVYGYYLQDNGQNKSIFDIMQNDLEEVTEKLSEMIARPYLRATKAAIMQTSMLARRKRHEFVRAVAQGLIPPETPPLQRRRKHSFLVSDLTQTGDWLNDCDWSESHSEEPPPYSYSPSSPNPQHNCSLMCNCKRTSNLDLILALELSRLQVIKDGMRQAAKANGITFENSSSTSSNSTDSTDEQLKLALAISLQESREIINRQLQQQQEQEQNEIVDNFLRSFSDRMRETKPAKLTEPSFFSSKRKADGVFQTSELHQEGFVLEDDDDKIKLKQKLKRSRSTSDLVVRKNGRETRLLTSGDEPHYHLDSDHSSFHEDIPDEAVLSKLIALPSTSFIRTKPCLLLHYSSREEMAAYEEISLKEYSLISDVSDISDTENADMEVCGILKAVTDDDVVEVPSDSTANSSNQEENQKTENVAKVTVCKKQTHNPFASLKAKLCSAHLPKTCYLTRKAVNKSIGLLSDTSGKQRDKKCYSSDQEPETCCSTNGSKKKRFLQEDQLIFKTNRGVSSSLRINICKSPDRYKKGHALEHNSSNEYESETGIPKSPTLFISGVSISRTPEPKSPGMSLISSGGRQSRSSSLSVPVPLTSCSLSISSTSLNNNNSNSLPSEPFTPSLVRSTTPATSTSNVQTPNCSPSRGKDNGKSKSASEPEREREMFRFPKSSTDGALSSVLHVQESNLSSDDFHEALFLLERSPKTRDSKRRKKSKKKDKEDKKEDVSSVL